MSRTNLKYNIFLCIYTGYRWHRNPVEIKISVPVQNRTGHTQLIVEWEMNLFTSG